MIVKLYQWITCISGTAGKRNRYTLSPRTARVTGGMLSRPTWNSWEARSSKPSWDPLCRFRMVKLAWEETTVRWFFWSLLLFATIKFTAEGGRKDGGTSCSAFWSLGRASEIYWCSKVTTTCKVSENQGKCLFHKAMYEISVTTWLLE